MVRVRAVLASMSMHEADLWDERPGSILLYYTLPCRLAALLLQLPICCCAALLPA